MSSLNRMLQHNADARFTNMSVVILTWMIRDTMVGPIDRTLRDRIDAAIAMVNGTTPKLLFFQLLTRGGEEQDSRVIDSRLSDSVPSHDTPMSAPATPTKRVLTEDEYSAVNAPRTPSNSIISEDLTARLQNLGSRVRKSVNEGYATQRSGTIPSSAPTPYSSPVKCSTATTLSQASPIFRSANDTLYDVFSSPTHASAVSVSSPLSSRRKRGRAEDDFREESTECLSGGLGVLQDEDSTMIEIEEPLHDEDVTIISDASLGRSPNRPIRPLKKTAHMYRSSTPPCHLSSRTVPPHSDAAESVPCTDRVTSVSAEWQSLFNHPF
ncbi:uncharacterized protein FOMMEDRAFT_158643 [Fomitiporia mediterranea MF3/22]|uniref:uncharacterized protein n=1 Tax=Fomitiporia mediterranea (strain MF3/22) TaxID=694068 RepID=UPI0004409C19|nr:uncharacterized protein FOMMEDRAFT_158643 [Fomitiporia mediterranea MF3/22]EJD01492.1 hypothetical protein FOMMEDRAFT_158643 [Fomitiporia mediterranea MF3/22]